MDTLKPAVGNPVVGNRFWGREVEIALFTELLDDGAHIQLVAQRRMGKTSLMREVSRRISDRYVCLHIDLQKAQTPADVVVDLSIATYPIKDLWGKTKDIFSNALQTVKDHVDSLQLEELAINLRQGVDVANWQTKGDRLFDTLASSEKPVIVFFDEVPILLNRILKGSDGKMMPENIKMADCFMSWLRHNSQKHQGKVSIVITGSIGLEPILHQVGLSATINSLTPFELLPWDNETAIGCLNALANGKGITFEEGACERMVARLGCCIPHHIQLYFSHAYLHCKHRQCMIITPQDADDVYINSMLSSRGHPELRHYEERLKLVLDNDMFKLAQDLLTETAVTGHLTPEAANTLCHTHRLQGKRPNDVIAELLGILEHDGYLRKVSGKYVFISNLLRDWWKDHFGFNYTPAVERKSK